MAKYSSYNGVSCGNITSINDTTQISINNINSLSLCSAQSNPAMTRLVAGFSAGYISQAPTGSLNNDTVWETNDYKPATAAVNKNLKEIVYGKDGSGNPLFVIVTDAATNSMRRISRSDLVAKNDWTEITFVNPPDRPGDDPPSHKQQTVQWGNDVWMSAGNMGDGGGFYTYYYIWRSTNGTTWNGISLTGSTVSGSGANKITALTTDGAGKWWFGLGNSIYKSTDNGLTFGTTAEHTVDIGASGLGIRELLYTNSTLVCTYNYNDGSGTNQPRVITAAASDTTTWSSATQIKYGSDAQLAAEKVSRGRCAAADGVVLFCGSHKCYFATVDGTTVTILDSFANPRDPDGGNINAATTDGEGNWWVGSDGDSDATIYTINTSGGNYSADGWSRQVIIETPASPNNIESLTPDRYLPL